jgi:hypothetical protein
VRRRDQRFDRFHLVDLDLHHDFSCPETTPVCFLSIRVAAHFWPAGVPLY